MSSSIMSGDLALAAVGLSLSLPPFPLSFAHTHLHRFINILTYLEPDTCPVLHTSAQNQIASASLLQQPKDMKNTIFK